VTAAGPASTASRATAKLPPQFALMVPGADAAAGLAPLAGGAAAQMREVGRPGNAGGPNAAAWLPEYAPTLNLGLGGGAVPVPILESLLVPLNISNLPPHLASTAIYSPLRGGADDSFNGGEASLLTSLPLGLSQDGGVTTMPAKYYCETCGVATTSETNLRDHEKVGAGQAMSRRARVILMSQTRQLAPLRGCILVISKMASHSVPHFRYARRGLAGSWSRPRDGHYAIAVLRMSETLLCFCP